MKMHLIIFSENIDRDKLAAMMDAEQIVTDWFYTFPNSLFVVTVKKAQEISEFVSHSFPEKLNFVTPITKEYWGVLPSEEWPRFNFLDDPTNAL